MKCDRISCIYQTTFNQICKVNFFIVSERFEEGSCTSDDKTDLAEYDNNDCKITWFGFNSTCVLFNES